MFISIKTTSTYEGNSRTERDINLSLFRVLLHSLFGVWLIYDVKGHKMCLAMYMTMLFIQAFTCNNTKLILFQ